jgi:hypothetical protein
MFSLHIPNLLRLLPTNVADWGWLSLDIANWGRFPLDITDWGGLLLNITDRGFRFLCCIMHGPEFLSFWLWERLWFFEVRVDNKTVSYSRLVWCRVHLCERKRK